LQNEKVVAELHLVRNRYINEAVSLYNQLNKRSALRRKLHRESKLITQSSAEILAEFRKLADEVEVR